MRLSLLSSTTLQMKICHAELPKLGDLCCRLPILALGWGRFYTAYRQHQAQHRRPNHTPTGHARDVDRPKQQRRGFKRGGFTGHHHPPGQPRRGHRVCHRFH